MQSNLIQFNLINQINPIFPQYESIQSHPIESNLIQADQMQSNPLQSDKFNLIQYSNPTIQFNLIQCNPISNQQSNPIKIIGVYKIE